MDEPGLYFCIIVPTPLTVEKGTTPTFDRFSLSLLLVPSAKIEQLVNAQIIRESQSKVKQVLTESRDEKNVQVENHFGISVTIKDMQKSRDDYPS